MTREGGRHVHTLCYLQTFICSVSCGPHGKVLCANYQNSEVRSHDCHVTVMKLLSSPRHMTFRMRLELLYTMCARYLHTTATLLSSPPLPSLSLSLQTVPSGVLCFFSSYNMLNKLVQRWQVGVAFNLLCLIPVPTIPGYWNVDEYRTEEGHHYRAYWIQ